METLCCTTKYRRLFGLPERLQAPAGSETALGPWYAKVLNIGPARLLHYTSSTSLLSVIIWQRERKTAEQRFRRNLEELLAGLGVARNFIEAELAHFSTLRFARATDRSVLGSMRDQAIAASHHLDPATIPIELSLHLAETPCGPRNYE